MKRYTKSARCKYCGATGLIWDKTPDGWRLFPALTNSDGTYSANTTVPFHACRNTAGEVVELADPPEFKPVTVPTAGEVVELDPVTAPVTETVIVPETVVETVERVMTAEAATPDLVTPTETLKKERSKALSVTSKWWLVLSALLAAGCKRILLVGPPGTGKSTTSFKMAEAVSGGYYRWTMTEGTAVEDLLGCWLFDPKEKGTYWNDGVSTLAMRNGKPLIIDEIDKMPAEIQSLMYALMDDHPEVLLPNGERIIPAEGYCVIATSNANLSVLPDALIDRTEACLLAMEPHSDALKDVDAGGRNMVKGYFANLSASPWEFAGNPTVRRYRAYYHLLSHETMTPELVAQCVFGKAGKEILSALQTATRTSPVTAKAGDVAPRAASGLTTCGNVNANGFICIAAKGHAGKHGAYDSRGTLVDSW